MNFIPYKKEKKIDKYIKAMWNFAFFCIKFVMIKDFLYMSDKIFISPK